jgi:hypothetical protein
MGDSGNAAADQVCSLFLLHACSNNKDFAIESLFSRQTHESSPVVLTEIEVEQYDIHASLSKLFESFLYGVAVPNNSETGFGCQQSSHTLPEQCVVIHQEDFYRSLNSVRHLRFP